MSKRRRNRITIVCNYCKRRKVKCDKEKPCGACVAHNIAKLCSYGDESKEDTVSDETMPFAVHQHTYMDSTKIPNVQSNGYGTSSNTGDEPDGDNNTTNLAQSITRTLSLDMNGPERPGEYPPVSLVELSQMPSIVEKFIGVNPIGDPFESINFYDRYTTILFADRERRASSAPFAWLSLVKKDHGQMKLWQKLVIYVKRGDNCPSLPENLRVDSPEQGDLSLPSKDTEETFREKAFHRDGYEDLTPYERRKRQKLMTSKPYAAALRDQILKNEMAVLHLTKIDGKLDRELLLVEKIQLALPLKNVIWMLIRQFFNKVYPYVPFFDEYDFRKQIENFIGVEEIQPVKVKKIKIEKRLDFANLGILLMILRLSYLSIFNNRLSQDWTQQKASEFDLQPSELQYLLAHPINVELVELAKLCLEQFELFRCPPVQLLQLVFLMKTYHRFAPEEGDGADGGVSQISGGMIVLMAFLLGINREANIPLEYTDERKAALARKLWFCICINDSVQAYTFGHPYLVDPKYYDVKLPYFKKNCLGIPNESVEKIVLKQFDLYQTFCPLIKSILDLVLNTREPANLRDLSQKIGDFENRAEAEFGSLKDFLVPFDANVWSFPFNKSQRCRYYLSMKNFLTTLQLQFFWFFESKKKFDLAFFYLRKLISISFIELATGFLPLISNMHIHFGDCAPLFLNPPVQDVIHKVGHVCLTVAVRLMTAKSRLEKSSQHKNLMISSPSYQLKYSLILRISNNIRKVIEVCQTALGILSTRYFYAWRLHKGFTFICRALFVDNVCEQIDIDNNWFEELSNDKLQQLADISDIGTIKGKENHIKQNNISKGLSVDKSNFNSPSMPYQSFTQQTGLQDKVLFDREDKSNTNEFTPDNNLGGYSDVDEYLSLDTKVIDKLWLELYDQNSDTDLLELMDFAPKLLAQLYNELGAFTDF